MYSKTYLAKVFKTKKNLTIVSAHSAFPFIFFTSIALGEGKQVRHEHNGMCPACGEHTTAGDSCCGRGAYVEGGLVTDECAEDEKANPQVCVNLLVDADESYAQKVHSAIFKAKCPYESSLSSGTCLGIESNGPKYKGWNVNLFLFI